MKPADKIEKTVNDHKAHGKPGENPAFGQLVSRVSNLEELVLAMAEFIEFPLPTEDEPPLPL
jgi:hypothetical protein